MTTDKPTPTDAPGVEFPGGIYADHTIREFAWRWLTDFLSLPIETIHAQWKRKSGEDEVRLITVALLLQRNPGMPERQAWQLVHDLKSTDLAAQLLEIGLPGCDLPGVTVPAGLPLNIIERLIDDGS